MPFTQPHTLSGYTTLRYTPRTIPLPDVLVGDRIFASY